MKLINRTVAVLMLALVASAINSQARIPETTLYDMFSDKSTVRTYVHPVTATGSAEEIDKELLERELVNSFRTRMTINFEIVDSLRNADIEVKCELSDFVWEGSEDSGGLAGIGRMLRGLIMRGNRARLQGVFTVRDHGREEILFRRTLKATMSGREITPDEAKSNLARRIVSIFFREAFSRPVDVDRI